MYDCAALTTSSGDGVSKLNGVILATLNDGFRTGTVELFRSHCRQTTKPALEGRDETPMGLFLDPTLSEINKISSRMLNGLTYEFSSFDLTLFGFDEVLTFFFSKVCQF